MHHCKNITGISGMYHVISYIVTMANQICLNESKGLPVIQTGPNKYGLSYLIHKCMF